MFKSVPNIMGLISKNEPSFQIIKEYFKPQKRYQDLPNVIGEKLGNLKVSDANWKPRSLTLSIEKGSLEEKGITISDIIKKSGYKEGAKARGGIVYHDPLAGSTFHLYERSDLVNFKTFDIRALTFVYGVTSKII